MNYKRYTKRMERHKQQRDVWRLREEAKEILGRYEKKPVFPEPETLGYKP